MKLNVVKIYHKGSLRHNTLTIFNNILTTKFSASFSFSFPFYSRFLMTWVDMFLEALVSNNNIIIVLLII